MSGFKRALVTIGEEEYRRLHNLEMERLFKQSVPAVSNAESSSLTNAFQEHLNELNGRQEQFVRSLEQMQNQVYSLEVKTEQDLLAEKFDFLEKLNSQVNDYWDNSNRLEEIINVFREETRRDNEYRDRHIQFALVQINQIFQNQQNKNGLVESWFDSACGMGDLLMSQYDHERFYPGRIEKIYSELNLAQSNLEMGMPEAALVVVQQAYIQLSEIRLGLEQKTIQMESLFALTYNTALNLYDKVRVNSSCSALDLEGQAMDFKIMLNYWSRGRYSDLLGGMKSLIRWMQQEKTTITIEQLENILRTDLPGFQKEFESVVYDSRLAAINSQIRTNIADIAIQALQTQGFIQSEFGYESDDRRCPFFVRLENIEGSQVTIKINSLNDQETENSLTVESHDSIDKSERELKMRSNEIRNSLLQYGLRVGSMETVNPGNEIHNTVAESRQPKYQPVVIR